MQVYIATISHRHGVNAYASKTLEGLSDQIYDYVCDWWSETQTPKDCRRMKKDDAIKEYFDSREDEYLDLHGATEVGE